jgi:selenide,water dikinase
VLSDLPGPTDARVLVDYRTADDAGVYALDAGRAIVQTVDFFTPIVDDPFVYGQIAAANAVSDVYAMGGEPLTALAIAGFPARGFDPADARAIFAGGHAKLREAGVALLGGHTVQDQEILFGYAITGLVDPRALWSNAAARPGDVLLLTKPLGTGIVTTAIKSGRAPAAAVAAAVATMTALNRDAADALRALGPGVVSSCTDVTGFGLAGHGCEMADASGVTLEIELAAIPLLPGVVDLGRRDRPGGAATNEQYFAPRVARAEGLEPALASVVFDPQTSGGLLACVAGAEAGRARAALEARGVAVRQVGRVVPRGDVSLVVR